LRVIIVRPTSVVRKYSGVQIDRLKQDRRSRRKPCSRVASSAGLGEKDQALASLEKAYEARSWYVTWLKVEPALDSLRDDLRFKDLVRRVGF
jgi:hypothetical protein